MGGLDELTVRAASARPSRLPASAEFALPPCGEEREETAGARSPQPDQVEAPASPDNAGG